jgi:hypothetical protein
MESDDVPSVDDEAIKREEQLNKLFMSQKDRQQYLDKQTIAERDNKRETATNTFYSLDVLYKQMLDPKGNATKGFH